MSDARSSTRKGILKTRSLVTIPYDYIDGVLFYPKCPRTFINKIGYVKSAPKSRTMRPSFTTLGQSPSSRCGRKRPRHVIIITLHIHLNGLKSHLRRIFHDYHT